MSTLNVDVRFRHASGFALDVAFVAGDGVTALVGASGSGKSTVLHLIAGILQPQAGTIRLGSRTLFDRGSGVDVAPERRGIGVVFQDHLLFPHLTVRKNLAFGMDRPGDRRIDFAKVVDVLEIGELLDRYPTTLSGGQRQRVAVGRALLRGPELLLLDEPLAALDPALKERVLGYLERAFAEWRIPTLFVCHERRDVDRLTEHVVVVTAGKVVAGAREWGHEPEA